MVTNSNAGRRRRVVASYESLDHGGNNRGLVAPDIEIKSLLCNFPLLWLVCVGSLEYILPWSSGDSDPELKKPQKLYYEVYIKRFKAMVRSLQLLIRRNKFGFPND